MGPRREKLVSSGVPILGVDPGYGRCGWGIVEMLGNRLRTCGCGVIETSARVPFTERLTVLHAELQEVIRRHGPGEAAVEQLYFAKNVKTAIDVGQARGVVILTCAEAGLAIAEYKPVEIKLAVTGYGAATKDQVQRMLRMLLGSQPLPKLDDASDALAAAVCHAHSRALKSAARRA